MRFKELYKTQKLFLSLKMTITQARLLIDENSYLIGEYDGDDIITHLGVAPSNRMNISAIAIRILNEDSYDDLLIGPLDFQVIVFLNLDDYVPDGFLTYRWLPNLLKKRYDS